MDKYQSYLIGFYSDAYNELFSCRSIDSQDSHPFQKYISIDKTNVLTITQDADITKTRYLLKINGFGSMGDGYVIISQVKVYKQGQWIVIEGQNNLYSIVLDFEDKIDSILIEFKNNLADSLTIPVVYEEADKQAYYAKKEQERKDELLKVAAIKCSTGADLVNIYFQPCNDSYARTEIILYRDEQMLAKYKVDEECFFKAITGLAYGTYKFILKQYDKDNNIILESNPTSFKIVSATAHIYGKGFVCN